MALTLALVGLSGTPSARASAADPCAAPTNPVVCENSKPGTPASVWDVRGAGDPTIQGFSTDISVNVGASIGFKVSSPVAYTMTVYRLGFYGGTGARQIATVVPGPALVQPTCLSDMATYLVDCGNWSVSATWAVPASAVSGVYYAVLERTDTHGQSAITFIVRDDSSRSDLVYQTADATWEAYNEYGGSDFYLGGGNVGRAYKISYNRPFSTRDHVSGRDFLFSNEYPMIRFLESNGYDVSYIANVDADRGGALLKNHKTFVSVGHDEYWSGPQRANVLAARDAGVNLAFFSGNEVYWKTRFEPSIDGSGTAYRTLVCYKETWSNAKIDPSAEWTGTWRDPRFSPPANGGNPENALTGTAYMSNNDDLAIQVPAAQGKNRFWRGTSVASQAVGATATLSAHTVGYESDEDLDNGFRPAGLIDLSTTVGATPQELIDFGNDVPAGTTTHHLTLYRAPSRALVFGAGTIQYAWALDAYHDGTATTPDPVIRQATVNLLADMGAQPLTLVSGLAAAVASVDATAPTVSVTSPAAGASLANGAQVTMTGTAADAGGVVGGVEVSTDGGGSWHPATGTSSWSYAFFASGNGPVNLQVRASDDSGNLSAVVSQAVSVTCPCSVLGNAVPKTPASADGADTELGVRFTADTNGIVIGVRFYKGAGNTGTHTGTLWSSTGTKLATGTFTNETATGWQTLTFTSPVSITSGTTYTASYRAPVGHYAADNWVFSYRDVLAPPLRVLRSIGTTGNGVYASGGAFPPATNSFRDTNYYVDPVFVTTYNPAPTVAANTPAAGQTGVAVSSVVRATLTGTLVTGTARVALTSSSGAAVAGTTSYDASTQTLGFTPAGALNPSTTYTATVSGAQSTAGVTMTPVTWSFTTDTVAACPCSVFGTATTPIRADGGDAASIEVGVQFVPAVDGFVSGVRFYKSAANTGVHTGTLWSGSGTVLATGTFSGETATGWQTLTFATPASVTAGTTYTVSYLAPGGHYSADGGFFTTPYVSGSITLPATSNGVYVYGTGGVRPTNSFNASNYWVDPIFNSKDVTPPAVTSWTPAAGATGVAPSVVTANLALGRTVSASSTVENASWGAAKAVNGTTTSVTGDLGWSSSGTLTASHTESFRVDLGAATSVNKVVLYPRTDGANVGYGFPVNFTIATSTDATTWTTVGSYTGYPLPNATGQVFGFGNVSARYVWVVGSTLRPNPNDSGYYRMQFADVQIFGATPITLSSVLSEPVVAASVTMALKETASGAAVSGTTSYAATTLTASFTPSGPLKSGTGYTASVTATDLAGNAMPTPASAGFTTGSGPDVPYRYASLAGSYNNVGITDDSATDLGNYDSGGATFSKQALTLTGAGPGATITASGVKYTFPTAGGGAGDNTIANGQDIAVSASGSTLGFLVASSNGAVTGTGKILYADGTSDSYTIAAPDWFATVPPAGGAVAVTSFYQNRPGNWFYFHSADIFSVTVPLAPGKTVTDVILPTTGTGANRGPVIHVFALGGTINLAQGKTATQSSLGFGGLPARAVDGNTDGSYFANSVSHTDLQAQPWWQVDLGSNTTISSVQLWNRTDCCAARLSNVSVFIGPSDLTGRTLAQLAADPTVTQLTFITLSGPSITLPANSAKGRYVRIQLQGTDYLSLAEVRVF